MRFCPKCGNKLKNKQMQERIVLICSRCNYSEDYIEKRSEVISNEKASVKIIGEEEESSVETLPTIRIDCPKCGHDTAVWWMLQTRSADEPTTQFYRCIKCNHTWRHYA